MALGGVILASDKQDLAQSFQVAKDFFERIKPGAIKFVLIGLSPAQAVEENILDDYFKLCVDNKAKPVAVVLPVKQSLRKTYNADAVKTFRDTINAVVKKHKAMFVDLLDIGLAGNLFQDETHLNEEGKAAVTAKLSERFYFIGIISLNDVCNASNDFFNVLLKYFPDAYKSLTHHVFCRIACNDFNRLSAILPKESCLELMARTFSEMTYDHLAILSNMLPKDEYNDLAACIFKISAENIRRKDKIKVGFFFENPSKWCGDELYNLFARDERFEPTIFYFPVGNEVMRKEFKSGLDLFKAHGLNVVEIPKSIYAIPEQDILFIISPYENSLPQSFHLMNLKLTTLLAHIPYSNSVSYRPGFFNRVFFRVLWKMFFASKISLENVKKWNKVGMPRGVYNGYPKMDVFFRKDSDFKFDWKLVRPDAKKIIWAPHHTVNIAPKNRAHKIGGYLYYSTFRWNYQFMYEFAKAHPETSWIVKPHPWLSGSAVKGGIFPSAKAFEEYLRAWNDLPNAKVYMGPYYQAIFATSDGMIQDSASFIAEYQYVDKPMIYLMREEKDFNELGEAILNASYLVDGKDFDGIAAMIQRVIIEGDDYKAAERKAVFDKYLNYPKDNGMLASEFIYKNICDELKLPPR